MNEYDVAAPSLMPFLAWGVAGLGMILGCLFALLRWMFGRMLTEIERRLSRIDNLETRFERLLAELPLHYQMRDDSIREYTAINARLDRIYELMLSNTKGVTYGRLRTDLPANRPRTEPTQKGKQ